MPNASACYSDEVRATLLWGAVAALALATVACGDDFSTAGGGGSSSSGSGGTASTSTGSDGGFAGQGGSVTTSSGDAGAPPACGTLPPGGDAIFHVTFNGPGETANPAIGDGVGFDPGAGVDTVPGLVGEALRVDGDGEYASYFELGDVNVNLDTKQGTLDFCFKPNFSSQDDENFVIFKAATAADGFVQLRKASLANANNLQMTAVSNNLVTETQFAPDDVNFTSSDWVRVTVSWDYNPGANLPQVRLWLDGAEIPPVAGAGTGSFPMATSIAGQRFYIGGTDDGTTTARGLYDELVIYPTAHTP